MFAPIHPAMPRPAQSARLATRKTATMVKTSVRRNAGARPIALSSLSIIGAVRIRRRSAKARGAKTVLPT